MKAPRMPMFCNAELPFTHRSNPARCARRPSWYAASNGGYSCCKTRHLEARGSVKNQFYNKNILIYGQLNLSDAGSPFISRVRDLHQAMSRRVEDVRKDKVIDTDFRSPDRRLADRVQNALPDWCPCRKPNLTSS